MACDAQASLFWSALLTVAGLRTDVATALVDFVSPLFPAPFLVAPLAAESARFHFAVPVFAAPLAEVSVSLAAAAPMLAAPLDAAYDSVPVPSQAGVAPVDPASVSLPAVALVVAVPFFAILDAAALSAFAPAADPVSFAAPSVVLVSFYFPF